MTDHPEPLTARVKQLELIEFEYKRLQKLMDYLETGQSLQPYTENSVLYVDQETRQIIDANQRTVEFLGYSLENLRSRFIDELEILIDPADAQRLSYNQNSIETQVYTCNYRHSDGFQLSVRVHQRLLTKDVRPTFHYSLEDLSLHMRVLRELNRREDEDHQFREKLKTLNAINMELSNAQSFDELCQRSVELGIGRLGFDRLGLWFVDTASSMMLGSYGVDEQGNIRDERGQSWSFVGTYVMDILRGSRDIAFTRDEAPIYNDKADIIGYGWHIAVPLLTGGEVVGIMTADNYFNQQPIKSYQSELLRLYGVNIGNLVAHQREQEITRKLSNAIQHSASMIIILNSQAVTEFVNEAFVQRSGYSLQEVLGKPLRFLVSEADYQPIWDTISAGDNWQGELIRQKKDGELYETIFQFLPSRLAIRSEITLSYRKTSRSLESRKNGNLTCNWNKSACECLKPLSPMSGMSSKRRCPLSTPRVISFRKLMTKKAVMVSSGSFRNRLCLSAV